MHVRLTVDTFTTAIYDLQVTDHSLRLNSPLGESHTVPFRNLKHIGLEGKGDRKKLIRIETLEHTYEGMFLSENDVSEFLSMLQQSHQFYLDFRFDPAPARKPHTEEA